MPIVEQITWYKLEEEMPENTTEVLLKMKNEDAVVYAQFHHKDDEHINEEYLNEFHKIKGACLLIDKKDISLWAYMPKGEKE